MLKHIVILILFFFLIGCAGSTTVQKKITVPLKPESTGYELKGYITTWKNWSVNDIQGDKLTELIISFALVSNGKISGHSIKPMHYREIEKIREIYPHLKISVAIGGWGADGFSDAVLTSESREIFTQSIADFVLENNFDGVDIDWEFPVNGGWGAIKARPEDRENHTYFLELLREKLDFAGSQMGRYLYLSVAANQGSDYYTSWVEIDKVAKIVDYVHLMTYDNAGSWSGKTSHHTSAGLVEDTVQRFITAGVPGKKLVIGGAFYGKIMNYIDFLEKDGMDAPFTDKTTSRDIDYTNIKSKYMNNPDYIYDWDDRPDTGRAPYIWSKDKGVFITFDDSRSIKDKALAVKKYNLGGAMFWDYSQDTTFDLLTAFNQELLK